MEYYTHFPGRATGWMRASKLFGWAESRDEIAAQYTSASLWRYHPALSPEATVQD